MTSGAAIDEARWVAAAKAGDFEAFAALVDAHTPRLFALARRITGQHADAEDVVQQTFLSALEHLQGFRAEARFGTWITAIATNTALKHLRKNKRQRPQGDTQDDEHLPIPQRIADWRPGVEQEAQRREFHELLDRALGELDEKYRLVFILRDIEEMSVKETAAALEISESNVKVRLMRARLMLREKLTEALGVGPNLKPPTDHEHGRLLEN